MIDFNVCKAFRYIFIYVRVHLDVSQDVHQPDKKLKHPPKHEYIYHVLGAKQGRTAAFSVMSKGKFYANCNPVLAEYKKKPKTFMPSALPKLTK